MAIEEEPDPGIPEWVVTFGDMMSLLLTFFIMLVSMSEMKQDEKFQAVAEALREQMGHDMSAMTLVPGSFRPRNSTMEWNASMGRAKKKGLNNGGQENKAVTGENEKVQVVRPGEDSSVGGQVYFGEQAIELSEANKRALMSIIEQVDGKPQKIEIRGHTSRRPVNRESGFRDLGDLAYERARSTMEFMVKQGIDPSRIRLSSAGAEEPLYNGVDPERLKRNSRVQILMWDERVQDLDGS
ncbi:MAG: OmpA family protein [Planctomycetes bacterium]|nr:OmpA family protein [Planctomycetota bacterium]